MSYTENIPQPTDQINNSQPQLLANFQAIDTLVNVNHVDFDDPSGNQGKHKWCAFPGPTPEYDPPVVEGEVTLFNSIGFTTQVNELTIIKSDMTEYFISESNLSYGLPQASGGFSRFASGVLMTWSQSVNRVNPGTVTTITPTNESIANNPPFTRLWRVYLTTMNPTATASTAPSVVTLVNIVDPTQWNLGFRCILSGPAAYVLIQKVGY